MSQCQAVCPARNSYNAVTIRINNPSASMASMPQSYNEGDFNAVNLEINNPKLNKSPIYSYPIYDDIVTADMANVMPMMPIAYETKYINSQTYIGTNFDKNESAGVPEPNLTTTEKEKALMFHGLSFKANSKPEIIPDGEIKPAIDIENVLNKLSSQDYDTQALQLREIFFAALDDKKSAIPYITSQVFSELINIAENDTSKLNGPTQEQTDIRTQIIANQIAFEEQQAKNIKKEDIVLPYQITKEEFLQGISLSEYEQAERNKEYAINTLAALTKVYADDVEAKTGNVVPLTDLPGASTMVNALKNSTNPSVKKAAIESLVYICRPEYKEEINAVLKITSKDKNKDVAMLAAEALKYLG